MWHNLLDVEDLVLEQLNLRKLVILKLMDLLLLGVVYLSADIATKLFKILYRIAGKFGGQNVWRIYYF